MHKDPVCGMHLKKEEAKPVPANKKTNYTCPMHPEVKHDHPGSCPKCTGRSGCCRNPVPVFWNFAQPDYRCRRYELQLVFGYFKCVTIKKSLV